MALFKSLQTTLQLDMQFSRFKVWVWRIRKIRRESEGKEKEGVICPSSRHEPKDGRDQIQLVFRFSNKACWKKYHKNTHGL
jgi:hypothetical protein